MLQMLQGFLVIVILCAALVRLVQLGRLGESEKTETYMVGMHAYRFRYARVNGGWRAYILQMPGLKGRDGSGQVTHRLYDGGKPYVCWDWPVQSLKDMQAISHVWSRNIQTYIDTGKRFG